MKTLFTPIITRLLAVMALIMAGAADAFPLPADSYAPRSVLADGRWVRIPVSRSGAVRVTDQDLRRFGFSNPEAVRVYGYGGARIPDRLDASTYVDDLPQTPSVRSSGGIVFYAQGPETIIDGSVMTHTLNPFSSCGFYFLTDYGDTPRLEPATEGLAPTGDAATTFAAHIFHETEEASLGESGHRLFGEDMRYTRSRTFPFTLEGRVEGSPVSLRVSFGSSISYQGSLSISINGEADRSPAHIAPNSGHAYGILTNTQRTFTPTGNSLSVGISLETNGVVSAARLDAIDVTYRRALALPDNGVLTFTLDRAEGRLDCGSAAAAAGVTVWDVTDIHNIIRMDALTDGASLSWRSPFGSGRRYMAWREGASGFMSAGEYTAVSNQNLHGALSADDLPDMVIIAPQAFMEQGHRIAGMRRNDSRDPLRVAVVDAAQVYNEFGSGAPDINAIRRLLKMVYDRGEEAGRPLRFALLLGRATFDNRSITSAMQGLNRFTLPTWQSDESLSLYDSYTSDDILMMLDDGSGSRLNSDPCAIAVGRIPASSVADLTTYVDKLAAYSAMTDDRGWKNRILLVADDGNFGNHLSQSETQLAAMLASDGGRRLLPTKAYVDAFDLVGGSCDGARQRQMRALEDGTVWWNYIGHASRAALTGDNMLTLNDINTLYLRRLPFFYGATCSFARWDGSDPSGLELLAFNAKGGIIAGISATREVSIEQNGLFSDAIGAEAFKRRPDGLLPTIGEFFRAAKNRLTTSGTSSPNKLRFVLLGDPSMRLATPAENVEVTTIAGLSTDDNAPEPPVIMARQQLEITGRITDASGRPIDAFNGFIGATIYDAEYSTTSSGRKTTNDGEGRQITFEEQGGRLYAGRDTVADGRFRLAVAMPDRVADNYRPAAISLYAVASDSTEATGLNRNFYVYGYDETADMDLTAPVIEYAYLNHPGFTPGEAVNPAPMFIAKVSDNVGINLSTAGVGRQMSLTLDGSTPFTDLAQYFTPATDGSAGGTIAYPLSDISNGHHDLLFRVYDTSGNVARQEIDFAVSDKLAPKIFEVFSDANPARTAANFYIRHDRPDATLDVTIAIYNMMGRMVWTSRSTDRSDMFLSAPLRWDLRDMGGRRVTRGVYVYRVTATGTDGKPQSVSGKIAVAGN